MHTKFILSNVYFLLLSFSICAQNTLPYDSASGSPNASISKVAWLTGHWRGEAFGGQIDEIWTPPMGNSMMFSFQATNSGKVSFYEFGTITEESNTLILRFKHFHPDLKGWEEKDQRLERPLVKITKNKAYFNRFTFEHINENEINVYVLFKQDDGAPYEMKFNYHRIK